MKENVTHKIKTDWLHGRNISTIVCNGRVLTKLKENFHRMTIRPVILYESTYCALKKMHLKNEHIKSEYIRWMTDTYLRINEK